MNQAVKTAAVRPGAHVGSDGVAYRVWAPDETRVEVVVTRDGIGHTLPLTQEPAGFWETNDPLGRAGDLYQFQLADGTLLPDVASRFQPRGVHGPSECIDPQSFEWQCAAWQRPRWVGQPIYELHIGTFTREGTFRAAIAKLDHLRALRIGAVEIMPVADFPGNRNWGYDGVALYAPARCYGRPDDFRALIDAAHERDLAVILDVVYNHVGPIGNHLPAFSRDYFHADRKSPWGQAYDLDGPRSAPVRSFLIENARYWLDEFRIDGFRLDATHAIPDPSRPHLLEEITAAVHERGGFVIAEDERNLVPLLQAPAAGGYGIDAVWSDDFHHQVRVALTGTREAYFAAYGGTAADVAATLEHGWSYRGQSFPFWKGKPRGGPCQHLPPSAFVFCIENHDQVGNRAHGERLEYLIAPASFRAASMLLCLAPYPPMIFMGQEWAASSPFLFFTDHEGEYGRQVSAVRRREFEASGLNVGAVDIPDPQDAGSFTASKLRWEELSESAHAANFALYRECLRERQTWLQGESLGRARWHVHVTDEWIGVRYLLPEGERLLLVALRKTPPLGEIFPATLMPPAGKSWHIVLHSDEKTFGGNDDANIAPGALAGPVAAWLLAVEDEPDAGT